MTLEEKKQKGVSQTESFSGKLDQRQRAEKVVLSSCLTLAPASLPHHSQLPLLPLQLLPSRTSHPELIATPDSSLLEENVDSQISKDEKAEQTSPHGRRSGLPLSPSESS